MYSPYINLVFMEGMTDDVPERENDFCNLCLVFGGHFSDMSKRSKGLHTQARQECNIHSRALTKKHKNDGLQEQQLQLRGEQHLPTVRRLFRHPAFPWFWRMVVPTVCSQPTYASDATGAPYA